MIKFSYRENKKSEVKSVVSVNHEVADLADAFETAVVNGWTEYGFAVDMQGHGRAGTLEKLLESKGVEFTIEHDVPVKKAISKAEIAVEFLQSLGMDVTLEDMTPERIKKIEAMKK